MKILASFFRKETWRKTISLLTTISFLHMCFMYPSGVLRAQSEGETPQARPWLKYTGIITWDESDYNFTKMLETMSEEERIQLAISLQMFPSLEPTDFGNFGLKKYEEYADRKEDVSPERPLRPKTFNEVSSEVIQKAFEAGRLSRDGYVAPVAIKRKLMWVSSHLLLYPFKSSEVDYHSLVQWVARAKGIPAEQVQALPTFALERQIVDRYFADLWDKLTPEQRREVLDRLERDLGETIPNKAAIASMGAAGAFVALAAAVKLSGFAFYTTMSVVIWHVGALFGITFPFAVYTTASSLVALLAGPLGWILATGLFVTGSVLAGQASVEKTASFIMALHLLKAHAFHEAGLLK